MSSLSYIDKVISLNEGYEDIVLTRGDPLELIGILERVLDDSV